MPAFSYTTGNPSNLVANQNASMADIQGPFTDLRTFVNGGLDETNVPNLSAAFTTYKTVLWGGAAFPATIVVAIGDWLLWAATPTNTGTQNTPGQTATPGSAACAFNLDPADWTANSRLTKLRLRVRCITNAVAPGTTFTVGLNPVTAYGGGSGAAPTILTITAPVSGSSVTFTTPGATSQTTQVSGDFNAPAGGDYCLAMHSNAGFAAGSYLLLAAQLQMRQT